MVKVVAFFGIVVLALLAYFAGTLTPDEVEGRFLQSLAQAAADSKQSLVDSSGPLGEAREKVLSLETRVAELEGSPNPSYIVDVLSVDADVGGMPIWLPIALALVCFVVFHLKKRSKLRGNESVPEQEEDDI